MKILLLNQTFHPDVASSGQHLSDLALGLSHAGHEVTVVTGRRAYDEPAQCFPRSETWHGINIVRIASTGLGKTTRFRRCTDFASFAVSGTARLGRLPRSDVVVSLTSPPLISVVAAAWAALKRSRFVYWVMDLNPDEAVAAGWLRRDSFPALFLEVMSRVSLRAAHRIVALDKFMERRILRKGIDPDRISVVPPWSNDDIAGFDARGREDFRRRHGLSGKFVVMHAGNHSPCHPLETLLAAARRLSTDPSIVFCFVGGGSEWRKMQMSRLPENVRMLPYQPRHSLAAMLSAADLHAVVMGIPFVGIVHPCKVYNILRVGSPFIYIGPESGPLAEILRHGGEEVSAGWARHGDTEAVVRHIHALRAACPPAQPRELTGLALRFSRAQLMPRLIAEIERTAAEPACFTRAKAGGAPCS